METVGSLISRVINATKPNHFNKDAPITSFLQRDLKDPSGDSITPRTSSKDGAPTHIYIAIAKSPINARVKSRVIPTGAKLIFGYPWGRCRSPT